MSTLVDVNGDHHGRDGKYVERSFRDGAFGGLTPQRTLDEENAAWLQENGLRLSDAGIALMTDELEGWPINAIHRVEAFKSAFQKVNGYTYEQAQQAASAALYLDLQDRKDWADAIRAVMGDPVTGQRDDTPRHAAAERGLANPNGDGSLENPVDVTDPRVQSGQILDTIRDEDGVTIWHRRRKYITPSAPEGIRLQATEPLSDDDIEHLRNLIAYQYAATAHRDEVSIDVRRDSPYSLIVDIDYEGSVRPNLGAFEKYLPETISEGSRLRTTDRMGAGTAGTRAVVPFPRPLDFELYYDNIRGGVNLADDDDDYVDPVAINKVHAQLVTLGYAQPAIENLTGMMSGR